MAIVIDTDVLIQDERRLFDLRDWASSFPNDRFQIAAITVAELWHGVERARGNFRAERETYVRKLLTSVAILPYTESTALQHARICAELEASDNMIGYYDLVVAATALEHNSSVATFNKRHFARVPGLKLILPT